MNLLAYYIGYSAAAVRYSLRKPRRIPPVMFGTSHYFGGK